MSDFALLDDRGRLHQLSRYATARAVVLYTHDVDCPTSRADLAALEEMRKGLAQQNVAFLVVDAHPRADRDALRREAAQLGVDIPILQDDGQLVTSSLSVTRTGEALLVDPRSWQVLYRGPVNEHPPMRNGRPLAKALGAFLDGRHGAVPSGSGMVSGCAIANDPRIAAAAGADSYATDIAPLLRAKCTTCHRHGGIAPWAMDRYDTVKAWSARMRAAILTGRMPPWHADPFIGEFTHDRSLSVEQKRALVRWIDGGAPRGAGADPLTTNPASSQAPEWPLGNPDIVLELPVQDVPPTGTLDYRYVHIPAPVTRDTWVRAVHIAPRNPTVMHHAALFVQYPPRWEHHQPHWEEGVGGFLGAYAPGLQPLPFPPDSGGFLPAGAILIFQLHYTTVGTATTDAPRAAFYFHPRPPALEARVVGGVNNAFSIPPNTDDYPVEATYVFEQAVTLHGLLPHMHFRGKRFRFEAYYPDGTREVLLSVPRYDFNWQTLYTFKTPKPIPARTRIVMNGAFDNSARNPANPDPAKEVRFGPQSWDEMFIGYMMYTAPKPGGPASPPVTPPGRGASPGGSSGNTR